MFEELGEAVGNLFSAIWNGIKALGEAFWNALRIIWYAFASYLAFIEAIFDAIYWVFEKIITIIIPPETEPPTTDKDAAAVAEAIMRMMERGSNQISVNNLKSVKKNGAAVTVKVNTQTNTIVPNKNGQEFTFTQGMDPEVEEVARTKGGYCIAGE